jgi:hypothetical protein
MTSGAPPPFYPKRRFGALRGLQGPLRGRKLQTPGGTRALERSYTEEA